MRTEIIQDPDILIDTYLHKLNYDLTDPLFPKYVCSRTGYCGDPIEERWPDPYEEPREQHLVIMQCRLQDTWEIWLQPGVKQEFAMKLLLHRH